MEKRTLKAAILEHLKKNFTGFGDLGFEIILGTLMIFNLGATLICSVCHLIFKKSITGKMYILSGVIAYAAFYFITCTIGFISDFHSEIKYMKEHNLKFWNGNEI